MICSNPSRTPKRNAEWPRWRRFVPLLTALCCSTPPPPAGETHPPAVALVRPVFVDATEESGLAFTHFNSATPRKMLPETMGSGVAFLDFDNDGFADLFLVNGGPLTGEPADAPTSRLFRNLGDGRYRDVTAGSGLDQALYGMGAAPADIDNDGDTDLFVSGVGGHRLYINLGGGKFQEKAREMGIEDRGYGSSAAFLDYDRDGYLDLFLGRYVDWKPQADIPCSPDRRNRTYCTPEQYSGLSCLLYRNLEGKGFLDVSSRAGLSRHAGKALGVVTLDHDGDGWPDVAVANDTVRNFLFVNQRDGTFREAGVESGLAYSESGAARGGMGIDADDSGSEGAPAILIGNFSQETVGYYRGAPTGYYVDEAAQSGLGLPTLMTLAFGVLLEDFNGDGRSDVLIVNGHIEPDISLIRRGLAYAQNPQMFLNAGDGSFEPLGERPDGSFLSPLVGRGLAAADIDSDGDLDIVITQNGRDARLIRNDSPAGSWIRLKLVARTGCSTPYGTAATLVFDNFESVRKTLRSGRSYLSAGEQTLTFSFPPTARPTRLEIHWPSGLRQTLEAPPVNRLLQVQEAASESGR